MVMDIIYLYGMRIIFIDIINSNNDHTTGNDAKSRK